MTASSIGIPKFLSSFSDRLLPDANKDLLQACPRKNMTDEAEDGNVLTEFKETIDFPDFIEGQRT
jgi:hypothetical protein